MRGLLHIHLNCVQGDSSGWQGQLISTAIWFMMLIGLLTLKFKVVVVEGVYCISIFWIMCYRLWMLKGIGWLRSSTLYSSELWCYSLVTLKGVFVVERVYSMCIWLVFKGVVVEVVYSICIWIDSTGLLTLKR